MKVLELFAGTRSIGKAFERRGHDVVSVDWDDQFNDCIHEDCYKIPYHVMDNYDVVWASPDCSTYSLVSGGYHRNGCIPISKYAIECDINNSELMDKLRRIRGLYFVENPRAGMRSQPFMDGMPRYTVTYCQYGDTRQKPTDIWTNHPNPDFKPPCKNGSPCHQSAPRGSRSGTCGLSKKDRGRIPDLLCDHIVEICEEYYTEV